MKYGLQRNYSYLALARTWLAVSSAANHFCAEDGLDARSAHATGPYPDTRRHCRCGWRFHYSGLITVSFFGIFAQEVLAGLGEHNLEYAKLQ
jgi:hypothetical protein